MIRHIVMWKLRGDTADAQRAARARVKQAFEGLRGKIPGLLKIEIGLDISAADHACDVVLFSEFESREALANYARHPEHLRVRDELGDLRTARHQVDYAVEHS
jgi:hypothetical protein